MPFINCLVHDEGARGLAGGDAIGREKLTESLVLSVSICAVSSPSFTFESRGGFRAAAGGWALDRSMLLPLPRLGVGDSTRWGGSTLEDRRCPDGIVLGIAGTGGAFDAGDKVPLRPLGDGDLNVRSAMDPPLF